jgi:hypothetical protein
MVSESDPFVVSLDVINNEAAYSPFAAYGRSKVYFFVYVFATSKTKY